MELEGAGVVCPSLGNLFDTAGQAAQAVRIALGGDIPSEAAGGMEFLGGSGTGSRKLSAGKYGGRYVLHPQDGGTAETLGHRKR